VQIKLPCFLYFVAFVNAIRNFIYVSPDPKHDITGRDQFWNLVGFQSKELFDFYLPGATAEFDWFAEYPYDFPGCPCTDRYLIISVSATKKQNCFVTLLVAASFSISCMLITRFGNVTIQTEMLKWEANAMPANWTTLRDKWWSYDMMRTIVELIALVLVTWTIVQHKTTQIEKRSR
jgi:hypothetical protein